MKTQHKICMHISWGDACTIQCCYCSLSFLQYACNRDPKARPRRRDVGCLLWVSSLIYVLPQTVHWCILAWFSRDTLFSWSMIWNLTLQSCLSMKSRWRFQNACNRDPKARPRTRDVGCLLWVSSLIYVLPQTLHWCILASFSRDTLFSRSMIWNLTLQSCLSMKSRRRSLGGPTGVLAWNLYAYFVNAFEFWST